MISFHEYCFNSKYSANETLESDPKLIFGIKPREVFTGKLF
jgi:hypothetical protein